MELSTPRLHLRPFQETDAEDLFDYARDLRVGPAAGWPPHPSIEESRRIIATVFAKEGVFAMEDKASGRVIEEETDLTVNGMQAKRLIYSQQQYMESQTCAAYFIEGTDHYYQVYFFCAQSKFDRHLREFETILASFHEI